MICDFCGEKLYRRYFVIPVEDAGDNGVYWHSFNVCNRCLRERYMKKIEEDIEKEE